MTHADHIAGEYEFLEACLGELEHVRRTGDVIPDALSGLPRFVALVERYGYRLVDPLGPPRTLTPATAWMFDPASGDYVASPSDMYAARVAAAREHFSDDAAGQARWEAAVDAMLTTKETNPPERTEP